MMSLQNGYCMTLSSINSLQLFLAKSHPIPRPQVISWACLDNENSTQVLIANWIPDSLIKMERKSVLIGLFFCYQIVLNQTRNGILLANLFWPTVRKNCSSDRGKTFEIRGCRPRICKNFETTRTIYSNSERSEQFLITECFFDLFLEVSHV